MKRTRYTAVLAAFMSLAVLAGCAGTKTQQPTQPTQQTPAKPKTLTISAGTTTVSMDVHKVSDSPSFTVLEHINETLFTINANGTLSPGLAESFKAEADGKTYTVKLKSGIKFSDGTPFNAEAVKLNMERILKEGAMKSLLSQVEKVEAKDETTVVFYTKAPFAPLQAHLGHAGVAIIAPSALAKGGDFLASNTVGTGPYVLKDYKKDQSVTLTVNPTYWGKKPAIAEVTYKAVKEDGPRMLEVESGTSDVAVRVPPTEQARLAANNQLNIDTVSGLRVMYIMLNTQKPPFNNVKARQAINYAVDKESIVKNLLNGAGKVVSAPMADPIFGHSKQTIYARDVNKAKQLLKEAGIAEGTKITFHHPTGRYVQDAKIAEAIAAQLKEVGLNVELKTLEWAQYLEFTAKPLAENTMQMAMLAWSTPTMDADYALYNLFHSSQWPDKGGFNRAFYKNDTVDAALLEGQTSTDPAKRQAAYATAIKQIWEDAPWLFMHSEVQITALRKDVKGFVVHPSERLIWRDADKGGL